MQLLTKALPDNHNLFFFGDKHDGDQRSSQNGWQLMCDLINHKYDGCSNNYCVDGGDCIEAINVDDKRFDRDKLTEPLPLAQIDVAIQIRQAIKKKMLWGLEGNHEYKLWKFGNISQKIYSSLCVDFGTETAKASIVNSKGKLMYKVYHTHGMKQVTSNADDPIRREANMQLALKRQMERKAGDCAVMIKHHTHKLLVSKPRHELYLTDNGKTIKQGYTNAIQHGDYIDPDLRWYGNAGSFLRLYANGSSGYAERAEYDPAELGFLILKVRDQNIVDLVQYRLEQL